MTSEAKPRAKRVGLRLRLKRALLRARLALAASPLMRGRYRARRFAYLAPHVHLADPSIAADIANGHMVLGGRSLLCANRSPFHTASPGETFTRALFGFDWLAHCEASENLAVRAHARRLVADFLDLPPASRPMIADHPAVMARRVIAWVTHSALLTEGQDIVWYDRLLDQLARDAARLAVYAARSDISVARLDAAIALTFHALSLDMGKRAIDRAERQLDLALATLIAPDGATLDRDCGTVAMMAADLVAMQALYRIRQSQAPSALGSTLADMIAFLRLLQHPDGGLVLMAGGTRIPRDLASEVIRSRRGQATLLTSAAETGFERLENAHAVLIADTGVPPRRSCSGSAGASALAFEFSSRADRILVSAGMPPGANGDIAAIYRSAATHSTILMDGEGLADLRVVPDVLGGQETRLVPKPGVVAPLRARSENGETLTLAHRGFLEPFGYTIERQLTLTDVLPGVMGRDRFQDLRGTGEARAVTMLFHLNPRIRPVRLSRADAIVLRLPDEKPGHDQFLFEAPGLPLVLEEGRVFEPGSNQTRSHVILIETTISGSADIVWRLLPYLPELS